MTAPTLLKEPVSRCKYCGHIYHEAPTRCDCMPDEQEYEEGCAYFPALAAQPELPSIHFITNTYGTGQTVLVCWLIKTKKRITFQISWQAESVTNDNPSSELKFKASNGYEVISEHRMDIQSRRLWLLGASDDQSSIRSGSMHVPTQEMCDEIFPEYALALQEWCMDKGGIVIHSLDIT